MRLLAGEHLKKACAAGFLVGALVGAALVVALLHFQHDRLYVTAGVGHWVRVNARYEGEGRGTGECKEAEGREAARGRRSAGRQAWERGLKFRAGKERRVSPVCSTHSLPICRGLKPQLRDRGTMGSAPTLKTGSGSTCYNLTSAWRTLNRAA